MPTYPEPSNNPACQCVGNALRAFFCRSGHLSECHYPYSCALAACSHLGRYAYPPAQVEELDQLARVRLTQGLMLPYRLDLAGAIVVTPPSTLCRVCWFWGRTEAAALEDHHILCPLKPGREPRPDGRCHCGFIVSRTDLLPCKICHGFTAVQLAQVMKGER